MAIAHCKPTGPKFVDITGIRYGKLLVVSYAGMIGTQSLWNCVCECGSECVKYASQLKHRTYSKPIDCGCEYRRAGEYKARHREEWKHWRSMRNRCLNAKSDNYARYGGAGITICERWDSFVCFLDDMGTLPTPQHTIDRIDSSGNYEPSNCRWATPKEQSNNRRNNVLLTMDAQTHTLQEWCDLFGASKHCVGKRLKKGWTLREALSKPSRRSGKVQPLVP